MFPARNKDGEIFMISRDVPRFISGELTANSKQPRGEFSLGHRENLSAFKLRRLPSFMRE